MQGWLESVAGPDYAAALMWTIVALIVLLVLLLSIRIVRGFGTGTFVSGGRNRKTRLAVMDATAVDSHRRLVLVRRDDVEHLILIGGPTDVVVEQNIRLVQATRRQADELAYHQGHGYGAEVPPAAEQPRAPQQPAPAPRPAPPVAPAAPRPAAPAAAPAPSHGAGTIPRSEPRFAQPAPAAAAAPRAAPYAQPTPAAAAAPRAAPYAPSAPASPPPPTPPVQPMRPVTPPVQVTPPAPAVARPAAPAKPDLDEAMLQELEISLDKEPAAPRTAPAAKSAIDSTLDEEMSRLLSDLAGKR